VHTVQVEHLIRDFDGWKTAFDRDPARREASGVRRYRIFRPVDDPLFVCIDFDFDSRSAAEAFVAVMESIWRRVEGTVITSPRVRGGPARSPDGAQPRANFSSSAARCASSRAIQSDTLVIPQRVFGQRGGLRELADGHVFMSSKYVEALPRRFVSALNEGNRQADQHRAVNCLEQRGTNCTNEHESNRSARRAQFGGTLIFLLVTSTPHRGVPSTVLKSGCFLCQPRCSIPITIRFVLFVRFVRFVLKYVEAQREQLVSALNEGSRQRIDIALWMH